MDKLDFYKNNDKKYNINIKNQGLTRKNNIFTSIIAPFNSYTIDYLFLSGKTYKLESKIIILAFIETTSRYVIIYKVNDRTTDTLIETFEQFKDKYNPISITSDAEHSFNDKRFREYLKSNNIKQYIHNVKQTGKHTPLSLIDRFCRTFRTMIYKYININNEYINDRILYDIVNKYNNSPHSALPKYIFNEKRYKNGTIHSYMKNRTPYEVFNSEELQNITKSEAINKKNNNIIKMLRKINIGDRVRIKQYKKTGEKGGDKWSNKIYTVKHFNGYTYELNDSDIKYSFNQLLKVN